MSLVKTKIISVGKGIMYFITIIFCSWKAQVQYYHISIPEANLIMYHSMGTRERKLIWDISAWTRRQNHLNFIVRYMLSINKIDWSKIQTQNWRLSVFKLSFIEQNVFVIFHITYRGIYVMERWGKMQKSDFCFNTNLIIGEKSGFFS